MSVVGRQHRVRVVVADDHPVFLESLARTVRRWPEFELVGEAADGRAAIELIVSERPDVALVDLNMPGADGFAVLEAIRAAGVTTSVVLLTADERPEVIYRALAEGMSGHVAKASGGDAIRDAVSAASRGEVRLDARSQTTLAGELGRRTANDGLHLTARELEVLEQLAAGRTSKEIADRLVLAESTVKSHLRSLYGKLDVSDRAAAVAAAMRLRILT